MNKEEFGKKLKELRELKGESQAELGGLMDVGPKQIQRYESGDLPPSHENLEFLCKHYKYDFISLLYADIQMIVKGSLGNGKTDFTEALMLQILKEKESVATKIEEKAILAEQYAQDMKQHYEDAKSDKKELNKALADARATIDGTLLKIAASLGEIRTDTYTGLAYHQAWVDYAAEAEAKGDPKKKAEAKLKMNNLLASKMGANRKENRSVEKGT